MDGLEPQKLACVFYEAADAAGAVLAVFSLVPVFSMVAYATLLSERRDIDTIACLLGQAANLAVNSAVKRLVREPRPERGALLLGSDSLGMPSNHAQFVCFAAVAVTLGLWRGRRPRWDRAARALAAWVAAAGCCVSRVYLQYHTASQVAALGAGVAVAWAALCGAALRPALAAFARTRVARALCITGGDAAQKVD